MAVLADSVCCSNRKLNFDSCKKFMQCHATFSASCCHFTLITLCDTAHVHILYTYIYTHTRTHAHTLHAHMRHDDSSATLLRNGHSQSCAGLDQWLWWPWWCCQIAVRSAFLLLLIAMLWLCNAFCSGSDVALM